MKIKLLLILLLILFLFKKKYSFFENKGYSTIEAEYILPQIYNNLITAQESEYIIKTASDNFVESTILSGNDTNIRKSKTTWLYKTDPIIYDIMMRICNITGKNLDNAEPLQVVKYDPGGFYKEHHDACCDDSEVCKTFVENGGQRNLTVLIYLNDSFTGGATRFPKLNKDYKPPKYAALIFRPLEENGNRCHPLALHQGLPIESGVKYICNLWFREGKYK